MMKAKLKSYIKLFCLFLLAVSLVSALMALVNQYLRANESASPGMTVLLLGILIFVDYKIWRWFCRKLDEMEKKLR